MAERDLLERLSRPDNLIEYQVEKGVKFEREYHARLVAAEAAINPDPAPVCDVPSDAILVSSTASERTDVLDLVTTSDESFNKVILVLAALMEECALLRKTCESRFYAPLALFGHTKDNDDDAVALSDGVLEAMLGRTLPLLSDLHDFTQRVNQVVLNVILQLSSLYAKGSALRGVWVDVNVRPVLLAVGDLLVVLVTLDAIVRSNRKIAGAWEKYRKMVDIMRGDPAKYGGDPAKVPALDAMLNSLDAGVVTGQTLRRCLDQAFEPMPLDPSHAFVDMLRDCVMNNVDALLANVNQEHEVAETSQLVGQFALYALYRMLTSKDLPDKKLFERLWKVQERVPVAVLYMKTLWLPDEFLVEFAMVPGLPFNKLIPKDPRALRTAALEEMAETLPATASVLGTRVSAWLVRAASFMCPEPLMPGRPLHVGEVLQERARLIHQAVALTTSARKMVTVFLDYHMLMGRGLRKRCIEPLARMLECIQVLAAAMKQYAAAAVETVVHAQRVNTAEILEKMGALRLAMTTSRRADAAVVKAITAATELIETLCISTESWSPMRRSLLRLALSVVVQKAGISKDGDAQALYAAAWHIDVLADYQDILRRASDCAFLYWVRDLLGALLSTAGSAAGGGSGDVDSRQGSRLQYLLSAFSDAAPFLAAAVHMPPPPSTALRLAIASGSAEARKAVDTAGPESPFYGLDHVLTAYECLLHRTVKSDIITPLARAVEEDLRIQVHSVHLAHMDPPSARTGRPPLVHLLQLAPLRITDAMVSLKEEVTHALERVFYDHTTVALHDWKTYGEMASVAADKYGLMLTDNHLPMGGLDSGKDVLEIMRNIHLFVERFNYNMHQQFFIEKRSYKGSKHIESVSLTSVSASIRQHGTGMMNTTINFAYQFLLQKFHLFAQFLFDEYIKTFLTKERTFFRTNRKELDNRFPYEHAEELNKDIRKLGLTEDKMTYLDKFRQLVTEIGNTLGYVRMVRSAGMHAASEAVQFIPDITTTFSFETAAKTVGHLPGAAGADAAAATSGPSLSADTLDAARQLDAVTKNLVSSFSEGVDYFKILVSVFQVGLSSSDDAVATTPATADASAASAPAAAEDASKKKKKNENSHLKTFFLIIPALTLNFVRHMGAAKDRMDKSVKGSDMFFTDDGLAVGIAYLLAILKQDRMFDSLHWWDSVLKYHRAEMEKCEAELAKLGKTKTDAERRDELEFQRRRILAQQREFDGLSYAFRGARTFFRQDEVDEDEVALAM